MGPGYEKQMLLPDNCHTFLPTGPLYDSWPKWLLCESLGLPCCHCRQPLLHSVFPSDRGSRVREEYANQHGSGQVSKDATVTPCDGPLLVAGTHSPCSTASWVTAWGLRDMVWCGSVRSRWPELDSSFLFDLYVLLFLSVIWGC